MLVIVVIILCELDRGTVTVVRGLVNESEDEFDAEDVEINEDVDGDDDEKVDTVIPEEVVVDPESRVLVTTVVNVVTDGVPEVELCPRVSVGVPDRESVVEVLGSGEEEVVLVVVVGSEDAEVVVVDDVEVEVEVEVLLVAVVVVVCVTKKK